MPPRSDTPAAGCETPRSAGPSARFRSASAHSPRSSRAILARHWWQSTTGSESPEGPWRALWVRRWGGIGGGTPSLPLQMPLTPFGQAALERVLRRALDEAKAIHLVEDTLHIDEWNAEVRCDSADIAVRTIHRATCRQQRVRDP